MKLYTQIKQSNWFIHYFTLAEWCSTPFCTIGTQHMSWLLAKTNFLSSNAFTSFSFAQASVMKHNTRWYGISLWLVQAGCTKGLLLAFLMLGPPTWYWNRVGKTNKQTNKQKSALMLCKHCSARAKTAVCYQYCISDKSKTQHHSTIQTAKKEIHFTPDWFSRL